MTGDHIEGTADEIGSEVVPANTAPAGNLFRTDDPVQVVEKATAVANALKGVLQKQGMLQRIGDKDHVKVEGWTTLGAMLGVVPVVEWARAMPDTSRSYSREEGYGDKRRTVTGHGSDWEARVTARTLDGRVVGAAEAMCTRDETRWKDADDYAVRSMAQTRATSKALASPLRFIVTLAGYEGTPAEEMTADMRSSSGSSARPGDTSGGDGATGPQQGKLKGVLKEKGVTVEQLRILLDRVGASNVQIEPAWRTRLSKRQASALIDAIENNPLPDPAHPSDIPEEDQQSFKPQDPPPPDVTDPDSDVPF